jgi:hypothetical protein
MEGRKGKQKDGEDIGEGREILFYDRVMKTLSGSCVFTVL